MTSFEKYILLEQENFWASKNLSVPGMMFSCKTSKLVELIWAGIEIPVLSSFSPSRANSLGERGKKILQIKCETRVCF